MLNSNEKAVKYDQNIINYSIIFDITFFAL